MSGREYDFIVVGGGSAGCALSNRLSEDGKYSVLLLEAGPEQHPLSRIPISYSKLIDNPAANWCYRAQAEDSTDGRRIPVPRGRVIGGSSSINGLVFVRGQQLDYDTWAQLGNRGWSYDDVLPVFRRMENYEHHADSFRARGGPLHVSEAVDQSPLYDALFKAGEELGLAPNPDYNGETQEGIVRTQTTIRNGRRMSADYCYLRPARDRANLTIETRALGRRLILEGKRCVGIEYDVQGQPRSARAGREVVVCAGTIATPQLLELSGIGRPEVLQAHGIEMRHELAGVGESLRDHMAPRLIWRIVKRGVVYNDTARGVKLLWQILRYATTRRGLLNLPSAPVLGFLKTRPELEIPDIQLHFVPFHAILRKTRELGPDPGMTIALYVLRPESLGSVHIGSADPAEHPEIRFNFLSDPLDRRTLIDGVRKTREVIETKAMDELRGPEVAPGADVRTDDEILDFIRRTSETAYHPVGTAKMGNDPMAVVDDRLRVHGMEGLRVADGSIMPTLISGNTNGPCIMIGEKCSDMMREDAA